MRLHDGLEDVLGCLQAAGQRAAVERLRERRAGLVEEGGPEGGELVGLIFAGWGEEGVEPGGFVVAV